MYAYLGKKEEIIGSVDKVVSVVRNGILAGTWKPGAALPSARQLGEDLHVNKNTVSKAYGLLTREGLLDVSRGRRARAAPSARRARPAQDVFRGELRRALEPALRSACMLGLRPEQAIAAVNEELTSFYQTTTARVTLVECNRIDAQQYAADLSALLGTSVGWTLIGDLAAGPSADVLAVPYYHLDDVEGQVDRARVIGLHIAPDPAVLLDMLMSAQRARARVGLICGNAKSAKRFAKLFEFYTTRAIEITHFRDPKAVAHIVAQCDKVYATPESFDAVQKLTGKTPPAVFHERIDPESLGPLRVLLADLPLARESHAGDLSPVSGS
jgi:GntR family transcriptional regulator